MSDQLDTLRNALSAAKARARTLEEEITSLTARSELTDAQEERLNRQYEALMNARREVDRAEDEYRVEIEDGIRSGEISREVATPGGRDDGMVVRTKSSGRAPELRGARELWAARNHYDTPQELRSRALRIIESGDQAIQREEADDKLPIMAEDRERIEKLLRRDRHGDLADYVIAASRPAYAAAFEKIVAGRSMLLSDEERSAVAELEDCRVRDESRAALSTVGANGGVMIPFYLDPTIILTNTGAVNPFRKNCRVETIPTNVWHGVSSTGVSAEWTSEAAEVTDASPTFTQPTVTPIRADAYVQASFEITQDSNIASQVGVLFGDAKNRLEATAFATGTGVTQPKGIVTVLQGVTASRVASNTNGVFQAGDVYSLVSNLPARHQDNAKWAMHWGIANLIRQQVTVNNPASVAGGNWVDFGPGIPSTLLGAPVMLVSAMQSSLSTATASNDDILILGDWSNYLIVDRIGMEIIYNPLVIGANRRPTGEVGWAAFWRTGADSLNSDAWRMLRV